MDIWRKILGRKPSEPPNQEGQKKGENNREKGTAREREKTEEGITEKDGEGKKEFGGGANEMGGGNTKKKEEERPYSESESGGQTPGNYEEQNITGKDSMVDSYINENVSQNRIPRIASQNSHQGQLPERGFFLENEDASHPQTVSATTFPKHNPTFPERHSNSYRRMDTVEVSTEKKHVNPEVSDAVLNNIYVMDHLKEHLDISGKGIKNWRYLAEVNGVSIDKQRQWELGEHYSRSEKMFETLKAKSPNLSMTSLVTHLDALEINKVKKYIEDHQLKKGSVEEFFDSPNRNHTGKVLLMLDLIDKEKWSSLGIRLGINQESLTQIMTDCINRQENPGGDVLNIISTSNATMTIGQFKKKLEKIDRSDIAGKLEKLSEKFMIGELLKDLDLARQVATMLNNPGIKNYKDLASACGISRETYQSLQPPCADSPTQKTIEEIVQRKPKYTMEDLFKDLKDIKRTDVIEVISPYFEEKDVLAWKRKWRITDE